jgi:hypothetical protein
LVLPIGKNFSRKAFEHFAHVLMSSLLAQNHYFALPTSENGKRQSSMISWLTSLMTIVLPISRKFCKCVLASSCTFPLNRVACTILMSLGLSSNSRLFVSSTGPVWIFSTVGAENLHRVFS